MNFAQFMEMRARGAPDALALVDRRLRFNYGEFNNLSSRFAAFLSEAGLGEGERVAIHLPNRAELAIALMGCFKAGVIAVPMNWRTEGPDFRAVLEHCAPACLVTTEERARALPSGAVLHVLTVTDGAREGSFWDAIERAAQGFRTVGRQNESIANLLYTSGTTALPKAAIHTHGMRVAIAAAMADCFALSSNDVGLVVSPMFHTGGMSAFCNAMFAGGAAILLDRWDLGEFLDAIARERVTYMHLVTTVVVDIARAPEALFARDLKTVRFTWSGGHSADAAVFETFERRIGGVLLCGYARTEGGLAYNPLDARRRRFDRHGFPNRNSSELAIVDPKTGTPLPRGATGEIVFHGDGVSPGYWDRDYIRTRPLYAGRWHPTGDLGFLDEDGALHFLGRQDHMIKTGGENVHPAEVNAVLSSVPGVADSVVLDVPDDRLGQRVAALVVPKSPALTVAEIDRACRAALGGFKVPRTIRLVEALPRLGSQKVDLAACRRLLADDGAEPQAGQPHAATQVTVL